MIKLNVDTFKQRFPHIGSLLEPEEIAALLPLLKIQCVESSEALIVEGTVTDVLYFVWEGQLDVVMHSNEGEYVVARVEPGDLLGEISLLSPGKTTATVRSELGCTALHLDRPSLEVFWTDHPHAASVFLKELGRIVAQRIRSADEVIKILSQAQSLDADTLKNVQQDLLKG